MVSLKTLLINRIEPEGLCFDYQSSNILLLACKGVPLDSPKANANKADKYVYAYNLETKTLDTKPILTISDSHLEEYSHQIAAHTGKSKFNIGHKVTNFAPSGISPDPLTGDYYILSARESLLAIYDSNKKLKHLVALDKTTIPQPEGITFDEVGNLYLATEGKNKSGKIFMYKRRI